MKIYLIRHGESVDDIEDSYGGIADYPLSPSGLQTAQEIASRLKESGIQRIFTSPYKRALQTAQCLSENLKVKKEIVDDLRERNSYGVLSGVNKTKAKEIFSLIINSLTQKLGDYYSTELVVGAEPHAEFDLRVSKSFYEVVAKSLNDDIIAIVTHGNVTRSIYKHLLRVSGKIDLDLLAITQIEYKPDGIRIMSSEGVRVKEDH